MLRLSNFIAIGVLFSMLSCTPNQGEETVDRKKSDDQVYFDVSNYSGHINKDGRMIVEKISQDFANLLANAIAEHGVLGAVEYCNHRAYPFLDSLAHYYGVNLKRTSLRYRNPENKPDTLDRIILENMQNEAAQGAEPAPKSIKFSSGEAVYFSPITMKPMCLQCHGIKSRGDIQDEVWSKIRELYPEDVAYDFNLNELRGAWGVLFPPEYKARRGKPDPIAIPK
jgi:hypothetical protein